MRMNGGKSPLPLTIFVPNKKHWRTNELSLLTPLQRGRPVYTRIKSVLLLNNVIIVDKGLEDVAAGLWPDYLAFKNTVPRVEDFPFSVRSWREVYPSDSTNRVLPFANATRVFTLTL